ncbi:class I SAM-dependent methyltransferase [Isoptericola sp. NEAU-Y5]|uniref:Class I SAM-dependent methyltransferase n=1 Tax=Isoptericola luteus TaxID=2879484 RepID=A0ABS7ZH17_9MICO|nr:class I SAM-dependent methyltransferase [Isoptericola sp. NEAU-Y5]MCA5894331.1 class I SAM-dependent methyltransferase [Isoptericola sp. NEAU-Y5]
MAAIESSTSESTASDDAAGAGLPRDATGTDSSTPRGAGLPADGGLSADAFADQFLGAWLGTVDVMAAHLGDRLGWYRALAASGPLTSSELAHTTGTAERFAREWLEQQAGSGIVVVQERPSPSPAPHADEGAPGDDPDDLHPDHPRSTARTRAYALPTGHAEVLTDEASLLYLAPLARFVGAIAARMPQLLEAYRTGNGVSWEQFGEDAREAQSDANRPWFTQRLAPALAGLPAVHDALSMPGARVLDVGCGFGWSTLALARAYPQAVVHGLDVDLPSLDAARTAAAEEGLGDRVTFEHLDAARLEAAEPYDAAFAFECVHDLPHPVEVLASLRRAVRPGGAVVVMDEAVADEFSAPADDIDRLMYGYSLFVCLPDGLSTSPSAGTGTVMRTSMLRRYALDAGFTGLDVLPVDDFAAFRFYQLMH